MAIVKRCPYCNSIWVCWNWMHAFGGNLDAYCEANPHMTRDELAQTMWTHECWNCGDEISGSCFETPHKVRNGIPYWFLTHFYKVFANL